VKGEKGKRGGEGERKRGEERGIGRGGKGSGKGRKGEEKKRGRGRKGPGQNK